MSSVEETLAWEAQWRPRAAASAVIAGIFGFAGSVLLISLDRNSPGEEEGFVSLPEALRGAETGQLPTEPSLVVRDADYTGDKLGLVILGSLLYALGALAALLALTYVFRATRARFPEVGRVVGWSIAGALALFPLALLVGGIGGAIEAASFSDAAERTAGEARDLEREGVVAAAEVAEALGAFALALAFVLVSLNAMRVGLFTRFMGVLGVIVGALVVFGLDVALVVRGLWLVMLGLLIAGRYPGGTPPAWETGRAEPWPTQQELREGRIAQRGAPPPPEPAPAAEEEGDYVPGVARRKRKKRR